ncbi:preprotein translocase subunit SecE [Desulfatirhabdium butyrativorans]|uniref:preprotein translocase subunit SecE n=1 Tax=Desulfatirhabdium butyrativorans TaxID=340467 RepID=UPI0004805E05|nr:preprotein translocase subunit SecE [Desulfatirhabdium butyrativorans]
MGRLLKKKDPGDKKKKKAEDLEGSNQKISGQPLVQGTSQSGQAMAVQNSTIKMPAFKASADGKGLPAVAQNKHVEKSLQFLREVRVELKKVTWPTRKQTIGTTIAVIVLVLIISMFLGLIDIGLSSLLQLILK